jgi:hypothetical protein
MKEKEIKLFLTTIFIIVCLSVFSQEKTINADSDITISDTLNNSVVTTRNNRNLPGIFLSTGNAINFLQQIFKPQNWIDDDDPFRQALCQLIFEASYPRYDSAEYFLKSFPYDSLIIQFSQPVTRLNNTNVTFVNDSLEKAPSFYKGFPFRDFNYPYRGDSIKVAVKSLIKYLEDRDSTIIKLTGAGNIVTPLWLNSRVNRMTRFWLKNEFSDSVTVWIGNPSKNTIELYLEQGVNFRRPLRQENYADAKINIEKPDNSKLSEIKTIIVKPQYWKYHSEASFVLSQAALSNWVKGGESSISTSMDITGYANYNNKQLKLSSGNFARIKLGFIESGGNPIIKNIDLLETNSKLNHKAFGKFDFSGIVLFKTQVARGYNYPNDSVPVSKFLNPSILTVGFGLDFKPNSVTSINFSPLSYKGTFVPDIDHIDQTKYGIPKGKRSLNEPGVSFMISNEYKPVKNVSITNRLQLFTNYIHNPQNVDIDWEMIVVANLNWFTDVRFNTHLIFDDDTKTVVPDKNRKPVLRPDGSQKKTARTQFKEMLGFSFVFRF